MINRIEEIKSFIAYKDYSLAIRRLLDFALDSKDSILLNKAIEWSRNYKIVNAASKEHILPENFLAEAESLLNELSKSEAAKHTEPKELLTAKNVSKQYGNGGFSLKPTNIHLNTNDILGVVGENGNGKTTLLRCISGQLSLDGGSVDYHLLRNENYYNIKQYVAFVPQRIPKWYGFLKDNLHFSASISGLYGENNELMVNFMLERLNLTSYAHLTWNEISSGYRTRFEIARVLLQQPKILILDEPLANLDINAQQTLLTDLKYMAKSTANPMGVILTSQQLHEVEKIADDVLLIKNGACIFRAAEKTTEDKGYAIEFETDAKREEILQIMNGQNITLSFNGGIYTMTSKEQTPKELLKQILNSDISIKSYRDITNSTKRYF